MRGLAAIAGLLVLLPLVVLRDVLGGQADDLDVPAATASQLANLAADSTEFLVALATATLGFVALMLSGKVALRDPVPPQTTLVAGVALACSIATGFIAHQVVLRSAFDGTVRAVANHVLGLHALQVTELLVGVTVLAVAVFRRV